MDYTQKRATLEALLDHWEDFFAYDESGAVRGRELDPDRPMPKNWTLMSSMSRYPSVVELVRVVAQLQRMCRGHYRHLAAYYGSEWRTVDRPVRRRGANGKLVDDIARARERVVAPWVVWGMVDRALDFLVGTWDFGVALELPPALNRKLRETTDRDGTHLTEAA